jgi:hypothetical protein
MAENYISHHIRERACLVITLCNVLAAGHYNPDFGFGPRFTGCNATVSGHDGILSFDIMKESR